MSTQELQFRHERVSAGEGKQAWERGQLEEGGALFYFNADLFSYIPLSICFFCTFIPYLELQSSNSCFGSSPVSVQVQFGDLLTKQPHAVYIRTALENEFIVN